MHRALTALAVSCALALAAGCGSSNSSTTSGASAPAAAATSATGSTEANTLKVNTTPKYGAPAPSSPVLSGLVPIAYRNITISPDTVRVKLGSTIRWTNYDAVEHNVTSRSGPQMIASKNFGEGKDFEVKLLHPGVIHYLCTIHPTSMNGTIEVVP